MPLLQDLQTLEDLKVQIKNTLEQINIALAPFKEAFLQGVKDEFKTYFETEGFDVQLNGKKGEAIYEGIKVNLTVPEPSDIFWGVHARIDIKLESFIKKDFAIAMEGKQDKGGVLPNYLQNTNEGGSIQKAIENGEKEHANLLQLLDHINNNGMEFYLRAMDKEKIQKDPYKKLDGKQE